LDDIDRESTNWARRARLLPKITHK
jgi:hypothetical protein